MPAKLKEEDVKNERHSKLVILGLAERGIQPNGRSYIRVNCKCDCGNIVIIIYASLISGHTTSCGCAKHEICGLATKTHGMTNSKEYATWSRMIHRCYNENNTRYSMYGGREIKVCPEWLDSFETFYKDLGPAPSPQHSIDRIDVNGNYTPSNVKWSTAKEQARNKTSSKLDEKIANEIRIRLANGEKGVDLAEEFCVTTAMISRVKLNQAWT